jgi:hypothetical protein
LVDERIDRHWTRRPVASARQVRADDAEPIGVERPAGSDQRLPPIAGRVRRARKGVDDQDLGCGGSARSVVPVGDDERVDPRATREHERTERDLIDDASSEGW